MQKRQQNFDEVKQRAIARLNAASAKPVTPPPVKDSVESTIRVERQPGGPHRYIVTTREVRAGPLVQQPYTSRFSANLGTASLQQALYLSHGDKLELNPKIGINHPDQPSFLFQERRRYDYSQPAPTPINLPQAGFLARAKNAAAEFNNRHAAKVGGTYTSIMLGVSAVDWGRVKTSEQAAAARSSFFRSASIAGLTYAEEGLNGLRYLSATTVINRAPRLAAALSSATNSGFLKVAAAVGKKLVIPAVVAYSLYDEYSALRQAGKEQGRFMAMDRNAARTTGQTAGVLASIAPSIAIGAAVGTAIPVPVVGTLAGIAVGALIGAGAYYLGGKAGEAVYNAATSDQPTLATNTAPVVSTVTRRTDLVTIAKTG